MKYQRKRIGTSNWKDCTKAEFEACSSILGKANWKGRKKETKPLPPMPKEALIETPKSTKKK